MNAGDSCFSLDEHLVLFALFLTGLSLSFNAFMTCIDVKTSDLWHARIFSCFKLPHLCCLSTNNNNFSKDIWTPFDDEVGSYSVSSLIYCGWLLELILRSFLNTLFSFSYQICWKPSFWYNVLIKKKRTSCFDFTADCVIFIQVSHKICEIFLK